MWQQLTANSSSSERYSSSSSTEEQRAGRCAQREVRAAERVSSVQGSVSPTGGTSPQWERNNVRSTNERTLGEKSLLKRDEGWSFRLRLMINVFSVHKSLFKGVHLNVHVCQGKPNLKVILLCNVGCLLMIVYGRVKIQRKLKKKKSLRMGKVCSKIVS